MTLNKFFIMFHILLHHFNCLDCLETKNTDQDYGH